MLSHSTTDIRADNADDAAKALVARAAPQGGGRSAATRRIVGLTAELAAELSRFHAADICTADMHGLMHGMNCTAAALTRILDQLRECPALAESGEALGPPRHDTVRSELEQAAAAAEDLQATAESLCRLLPTETL